tara:strand:+ start:291 stop:1355 length:1065 start_codon:yes stop_codon:yes gene_type:complete
MSGLRNFPSLPFEKFRDEPGPIIDTRSPQEYLKGHWPGSKNIPLFTDKERESIGITYKKGGQLDAIKIGINLIIPKLSSIKRALNEIYLEAQNKNTTNQNLSLRIYCWRGGMRSQSLVWLSRKLNIKAVQLNGGYKSYRKWVLTQFDKKWPIYLLGGKTGSGKTKILTSLSGKNICTLDLEGLANHRGSSFGGLGQAKQPTCEHYENLISESLSKLELKKNNAIWIEDESPNLGNCRIPNGLIKQMKVAPVLEIVKNKGDRIKELIEGYSKYSKEDLKAAILRIKKRLGANRTNDALQAISIEDWETACEAILDYYDRCYEYQLKKVSQIKTIDLSGMSEQTASNLLIHKGYVY